MKQFETLCNEYRENKRLIEELTAMNEDIKAGILALMGDNDTMIMGSCKATNKTVTSCRFDSKSFKEVHPELFGEYNRETTYKRFTVV